MLVLFYPRVSLGCFITRTPNKGVRWTLSFVEWLVGINLIPHSWIRIRVANAKGLVVLNGQHGCLRLRATTEKGSTQVSEGFSNAGGSTSASSLHCEEEKCATEEEERTAGPSNDEG